MTRTPHLRSSRREDFAPMRQVFLDAAYMHPISLGARAAVERYLDFRASAPHDEAYDLVAMRERVLQRHAALIGAEAREVSFVGGTMAGENLVINALGLNQGRGRIVTDSLHFFGSLYLYEQLQRRGTEVEVLPARNNRVEMADLEAALRRPTDLVSVSLVSAYNGFRHDLDEVCRLAHGAGAPVYADIIQAAGAVPFDVRASGVDFCAGATYKWLMGDFGLGFLYVRRERQAALDPDMFGYRQLSEFASHPEADRPITWQRRDDAAGLFMLGTPANGVVAQLDHALGYIHDLGVDWISDHRAALLDRLRPELQALGAKILTPENPGTPILAFSTDDIAATAQAIQAAGLYVTAYPNRIRVAPSVYNDDQDIDRLVRAVAQARV